MGSTLSTTVEGEDMVCSHMRVWAGVSAHRDSFTHCLDKKKGVIVEVRDDEDMPIDQNGNRAEIIMDGLSTVKRMNPSRLIQHYINAASRDLSDRLRAMSSSGVPVDQIKETLLGYYKIVTPRMVPLVCDDQGVVTDHHLQEVLKDGIYLWTPVDEEQTPVEISLKLRNSEYKPHEGPVQYRGMSGRLVTTKKNVLIGSMYIMLLEKTGRNWAATSSSKLSLFGIPAKLTAMDRNSSPGRNQPIRFGESEARLFVSTVGGKATAELFDNTNNPVARRMIQERILTADKPTAIDTLIEPSEYPRQQSRVLGIIRHFGHCEGWEFTNEEE